MKTLYSLLIVIGLFVSCKSSKTVINNSETDTAQKQDTIKISNDDLEYEVIIIESGFDFWMASRAKPRSYYSQSYLETKNSFYVSEWNNRVRSSRFSPNLYETTIDYSQGIDYGLEVNYLLYHYFVFFQEKYKQQLSSHIPRF
ncbi:hypothetical protein BZARG_90 [Bizionia argentinensis JUB59]|uniref:Lipoprotein n=1 Tax=Bizionia argentinensis JUB59 TaxID=1046627 RepID=G2E979_9FLAO|nr:DUF6146 family protein [Bizionia argentinensis]EGV44815.1 hypothetical protein BZARG_90 [Bizionia argentinensis JUB59]